jgi:uncharacterized membrane protein YeiH
MILDPTPALLDNLYWITLFAVIVSSASAVLMAGFKQLDLFGVIIIAIATGLGGGSLRDMLLDREVFWDGGYTLACRQFYGRNDRHHGWNLPRCAE